MKINSKIISILFLICCVFFFTSCFTKNIICTQGSGIVVQDKRAVIGFKTVSIQTPGKVYVTQGNEESVTVETDINLKSYIQTQVDDNNLEISSDGILCPKKLNYYITMKDIKGFKILGSADIIFQSNLKTNELYLQISGSGDIVIDTMDCFNVGIQINGSGDVKIGGKTEKCAIEINGSGDIIATNLITNFTDIGINGSGNVRAQVLKELKAVIRGSGDIYYQGEPENVKVNIFGSGNVRKVNDK